MIHTFKPFYVCFGVTIWNMHTYIHMYVCILMWFHNIYSFYIFPLTYIINNIIELYKNWYLTVYHVCSAFQCGLCLIIELADNHLNNIISLTMSLIKKKKKKNSVWDVIHYFSLLPISNIFIIYSLSSL